MVDMRAVRRGRQRPIGSVLVIVWVAAVLAAGVLPTALPSRAQGSTADPDIGEWCPANAKSWDVLILMDESQSLSRMDPNRERIEAAVNLIESLEEKAGEDIRIRVALAAFGTEFELRKNFTDLAGGAEDLITGVNDFNQDDLNTDYVLALYGVLGLDWSGDCNKVVWYTDGEHDLTDAHRGGADSRTARPYDALDREIVNRSAAEEVQELLIAAVCGAGESDETASGYGGLSDRLAQIGVPIEFSLHYFELEEGDSKTLIEMMQRGDCGEHLVLCAQAIVPGEIPDFRWCVPRICQELPEPRFYGGEETVWPGGLPDGAAPAFVRSVIIRASGAQPELSTQHRSISRNLAEDGSTLTLTLNFDEVPYSSFSPDELLVRGEGVEESCWAVVFESPALEVSVSTDPIFLDTPEIEMRVQVDEAPLSSADESFMTFSVDGEAVIPEKIDDGRFLMPQRYTVGEHTLDVRLESEYAPPALAATDFSIGDIPVCRGIPEPHWLGGNDPVWSLDYLSDAGIARAFVREVIVRAAGDEPELSTEHPFRGSAEDGAVVLTLTFSEEAPLSLLSPNEVEVRGERVEKSCWSAALETPSMDVNISTSPIFSNTEDIEIQVEAGVAPLSSADEGFVTVLVDGEPVGFEMVDDGRLSMPQQYAVGEHTLDVLLESRGAAPADASDIDFEVVRPPDGPIMSADSYPDKIEDTEFTIPITIDDEGRPGSIRLLPADPIVGTDGTEVSAEVLFPDGSSEWNSGEPKPDYIVVVLEDSVQTPPNHHFRFGYDSDPSDPAGETRGIPVAVPVGIDHPPNRFLERIIIGAFLLALLVIIWLWLYGINRLAGRIRRRRKVLYAHFRADLTDDGWVPASGIDPRLPRYSPSSLRAGRLRVERKTPFLVWRPPCVVLSLEGRREFIGAVGDLEVSGRSTDLSERRLDDLIVLVGLSGPPFEGVVMAPTDPAALKSTEEQLADHVRRALKRLPPPDQD